MRPEEVANLNWTHVDAVTGETLTWHQEDEEAVHSRGEAIAVLQRTLNFWVRKLRDDLVKQKRLPLDVATAQAKDGFRRTLHNGLRQSPNSFAARFGVTVDDLDWSMVVNR